MPAYITWDRFLANQERLAANRSVPDRRGRRGKGTALLGGLAAVRAVWAAHDGAVLGARRTGHGTAARAARPTTASRCARACPRPPLDELVAGQILAAVEPAALEASLAAVAGVERERAELARQWQLRRERAGYEAERAARQYQACEPENRLVARELERRWEEALKQQRQLEEEYERLAAGRPGPAVGRRRAGDPVAGRRPAGGLAGGDDHARPSGNGSPGFCWST